MDLVKSLTQNGFKGTGRSEWRHVVPGLEDTYYYFIVQMPLEGGLYRLRVGDVSGRFMYNYRQTTQLWDFLIHISEIDPLQFFQLLGIHLPTQKRFPRKEMREEEFPTFADLMLYVNSYYISWTKEMKDATSLNAVHV